MAQLGYYRFPALLEDILLFVADDDLWLTSDKGGIAHRLTSGVGYARRPLFSADASQIGFVATSEGETELYSMPALGGLVTRLTYHGATVGLVGSHPDGDWLYASNFRSAIAREFRLYKLPQDGGVSHELPFGPGHNLTYATNGAVVIGRNTQDPARWKRYRGGTAGDLWIDRLGNGQFARLINLPGNLASPVFIKDRLFFLSDHEGIGNIYSCNINGLDLQRHTDHETYYARNLQGDGHRLIYHAGGDIYIYNPQTDQDQKIAIELGSALPQKARKFVDAAQFLEEVAPSPKGLTQLIIARGKPFTLANHDGPVQQHGILQGVRYRKATYLPDGKRFLVLSDHSGQEVLEIHYMHNENPPLSLLDIPIGHVLELKVAPNGNQVAITNQQLQLLLIDLDTRTFAVVDQSPFGRFSGLDWSAHGEYLAFAKQISPKRSGIHILHLATGEINRIGTPVLHDFAPRFDPSGKYLYFLSARTFNPVYDALKFDLSFVKATKPYLVTLQKETPSPFLGLMDPPSEPEAKSEEKNEGPLPLEIDFEGIEHRILAFPIQEARIGQLEALEEKILYTVLQVEGSLGGRNRDQKGQLMVYDLKEPKEEMLTRGLSSFILSGDRQKMTLRYGNKLRVVKAGAKVEDKVPDDSSQTGFISLARISLAIEPQKEWQQMLKEAWRLVRDYFWTADISGIDWPMVYERYSTLVPRLSSRSELSDLMWEMQGELGTSHAYEMGGDYRRDPNYKQGHLAADFEYEPVTNSYRITHLVHGDSWSEEEDSPLLGVGVQARVGDHLLSINGQRLSSTYTPEMALLNMANREISISLQRGDQMKTSVVKTLRSGTKARYRQWVDTNRKQVHEKTQGRIGYIHVPNMGPDGFAEFFRSFLVETEREGLIIDVRYNGGGHVSQLLLEKLARKRIGYDLPRYGLPDPYPGDTVPGPLIALTNENAGSDGDIFSHSFKLMQLGPLIGKRTWGGVIGIWARHPLVDGTMTTQPEFSFWFKDVGWGVENYGTDPDIEVENLPQDYADQIDRQLNVAIAEAIKRLPQTPYQPTLSTKPNLAFTHLPPRPKKEI